MSDKLYTIAEMAKVLNIPESTLRFYRDRYSEYIPSTGEGRKKRYLPEALEALRIIAEENKKNATAESIAEQLSQHFTAFIEPKEITAISTAGEQQQDLKDVLTLIADQKKQIEFLAVTLAESNRRVTAIEQQLAAVQEQQEQAITMELHFKEIDDKLLQLREEMQARKNKSIWDKIFKR